MLLDKRMILKLSMCWNSCLTALRRSGGNLWGRAATSGMLGLDVVIDFMLHRLTIEHWSSNVQVFFKGSTMMGC